MTIKITQFMSKNLQKNIKYVCLSISLLVITPISANENNSIKNESSTGFKLGTPDSFLKKLRINEVSKQLLNAINTTNKTQLKKELTSFTLIDNLGGDIKVIAENFYVENDGTLSMDGQAAGIANSKFILQGNSDTVYGWVILEGQDLAYEYTTKNGELVVDEINITDVRPICNLIEHNHLSSSLKSRKNAAETLNSEPHIGGYTGEHVGQLESKPGSSYVILLDTSKIMTGDTPYDRSKEHLWTTWQILSASLSMFDVNVTTNRNVYNQAAPSKRGGGTLYPQAGRSSCHFAFGTSTFCTLYKESDGYGQGRIAAHEFGHLFHLNHDGGLSRR